MAHSLQTSQERAGGRGYGRLVRYSLVHSLALGQALSLAVCVGERWIHGIRKKDFAPTRNRNLPKGSNRLQCLRAKSKEPKLLLWD